MCQSNTSQPKLYNKFTTKIKSFLAFGFKQVCLSTRPSNDSELSFASIAYGQLFVLSPKHHKQGWKKKLENNQYTSAEYLCRRCPMNFLLSPPLSKLFPSSSCPLTVLWRTGHSWPEGKLTQFLLLTGQSPSCNAAKAITQTFSLGLGICHSHFRTETISQFNFFLFFPPFSPVAAVQQTSSCIQKFFKRRKNFFSDAQTGTAWLIVKWRNSWGGGFRAEGGSQWKRIL